MNQQQDTAKCACCEETIAGEPVEVVFEKYCIDCFAQGIVPKFEAALNEANYPVIYNNFELSIRLYTRFFTPDFLRNFEAKEKEYKTPIADRIYCSAPACAAFLGLKSNHQSNEGCPACGGKTCVDCAHSITDDSHQCVQETDRFEGLTRGSDYQICPDCNTAIQLRDGCNHVTCSVCRGEFCFLCAQQATDNSGHWNYGSPCPRFGQPRPNAVFTDNGGLLNPFEDADMSDDEDGADDERIDADIAPPSPGIAFHLLPNPTMRDDILLRSLTNPLNTVDMPPDMLRNLLRMIIDGRVRRGLEEVEEEAALGEPLWPSELPVLIRDRQTVVRVAAELRASFTASDPTNPDIGLQSITLLASILIFAVDVYTQHHLDAAHLYQARNWYELILHYGELTRGHGAFVRSPELLDVYQRYLYYYDLHVGELGMPLDALEPPRHQYDVDRTRARLQRLINNAVAVFGMRGALQVFFLPQIVNHRMRLGRRRIDEVNAEDLSSASREVNQRNADRQTLLRSTEELHQRMTTEQNMLLFDLVVLSASLITAVDVYTVDSIRDDDERTRKMATIRSWHRIIVHQGMLVQAIGGFNAYPEIERIYLRYTGKYEQHIGSPRAEDAVEEDFAEDAPRDTSEDVPGDILDEMVESLMATHGLFVGLLVRLERRLIDEAERRRPVRLGV